MNRYPPGYHITWGTYGMRLHGDDRPFVDKDHNVYGTPFPPADPHREAFSRDRMRFAPVLLTEIQRREFEASLTSIATRFGWCIHAIGVQSDHVHIVIVADREGDPLREALKGSASHTLNAKYGKRPGWAHGGSDKHLYEPDYFATAVAYVLQQRDW